eukprot:1013871-Pelagomonas_calceolata.AAC.1
MAQETNYLRGRIPCLSSHQKEGKLLKVAQSRVTRRKGGKRPQSRRWTASLFINAHEVMKKKR